MSTPLYERVIIIRILFNEGRTVEQKRALYKTIAGGLASSLNDRSEDVFIGLVVVKKKNWFFGNESLSTIRGADWQQNVKTERRSQ